MIDIKSLTIDELKEYIESIGHKGFRAKQIYDFLHKKQVSDFDQMNNLPKALLEHLKENTTLRNLVVETVLTSKEDGTKKILFKVEDGHYIETVMMRYSYGYSICISSQVGCKMGCTFCASGIGGLERQLYPSEMLEQIYAIERMEGEPCHSVVVMGTGEPFDNFDNLIQFIHLLNSPLGRNLGQRHITVSTSGLVPEIKAFADLKLQVNLAISLHSVNQSARETIMPITKKHTLADLREAVVYYIEKTNRRVTFEFTVIEGVNDSREDAKAVSQWLRGLLCHLNLIPLNTHVESKYKGVKDGFMKAFKTIVEGYKIPVTIRRSLGGDIDAACGQLRHKHGMKE